MEGSLTPWVVDLGIPSGVESFFSAAPEMASRPQAATSHGRRALMMSKSSSASFPGVPRQGLGDHGEGWFEARWCIQAT